MAAALPQSAPLPEFESRAPAAGNWLAEFNLLLACCAAEWSEPCGRQIREILQGPVDWERLIQLAQRHGVVPQVYRALSAAADMVPADSLQAIRVRYESNARQALWLTRELLRVHEHLAERGVEALPYKGPVLAESLYDDVALRQFSDLDLLVRPADLRTTRAALAELGYTPGLQLSSREERAYLRSGYEYTFDSVHGRNLLEIKWQILPRFYSIEFDVNGFFDRAAVTLLGGHAMRTLCQEDLMLVLCVHAAKHAWTQLSWLCDVAQLARSQSLGWDWLREGAAHLGVERIVAVTFLLAQKLLRAPMPDAIEHLVRKNHRAATLADGIVPLARGNMEHSPESISYFRLMMEVRERWQDRLRFLGRLLLTPSAGEWSAVRLPAPLFSLYRVVRIFRLARRLVSAALG